MLSGHALFRRRLDLDIWRSAKVAVREPAVLSSTQVVSLHRLAERRSLAYHRALASRLTAEPAIVDEAIRRARAWAGDGRAAALRWSEKLEGPRDDLIAFLCADTEEARELRQSTPFAGMLEPRERWRLWREVREEFEREAR